MEKGVGEARWLIKQARPYLPSLIRIVITGVIASLSSVGMAIASKTMIDSAVDEDVRKAVLATIIFAILIIIHVIFEASSSVFVTRTSEKMTNSIQSSVLDRLSRSEWSEYSRYHSGDIVTRLSNDVNIVSNSITRVVPDVLAFGIQLAAAFITLMFYEPILAVLAFLIGPAAILGSRLMGKKLKELHIKRQETESRYRQLMQEIILNLPVVKAFNLEEKEMDQVNTLQNDRLRWVMNRSRLEAVSRGVLSLGYWMGFFLAFGWGVMRLSAKKASFGTIAAFLQLVEQIQSPFVGLAYSIPQLTAATASAGRLIELEGLSAEKTDGGEPCVKKAGIKFENVCYGYKKDREVLKCASFSIMPGEMVGLIGASGQGKTTIVRLLLSFVQPLAGRIAVFDESGLERDAGVETRRLISYVPQGNTLFSGTIADNLRDGNPEATNEELLSALDMAGAKDFVKGLPGGMNYVIRERGQGISEGQAQRLTIARAFLRKSLVLVLDEATSQLDSDTEKKIFESITKLEPARTCIIITHRMEALAFCNRILELNDGQIKEKK